MENSAENAFKRNAGQGWTQMGIREMLRRKGVRPGAKLLIREYSESEGSGRKPEAKVHKMTVVHVYPHVVQLESERGITETPGNATLLMRLRNAEVV